MMIKWLFKLCPSHLYLSQQGGGEDGTTTALPVNSVRKIYFGNLSVSLGLLDQFSHTHFQEKKEAEK